MKGFCRAFSDLQRQRSLSDGRDEAIDGEHLRGALEETEANQCGSGDD